MPSTNVFVVLNLKQRWMMYCNHYFVLPIIEDIESLRLPLCHCQYLPTDTNTSLPILQKCWTKLFHSTVLSKIDLREGEGESEKMTKYSRSFYPRLLYPFCRMCVETFDSSCNSNGSDQIGLTILINFYRWHKMMRPILYCTRVLSTITEN